MNAKHRNHSVHAILLLVAASLVPVQAVAQDIAAKIDHLVSQYYDVGKFNGAVLVAQDGKVIYEAGYGYANMDWKIPNTPDTRFRVGSVTKQFTATIILKLVEQGKVSLDGKITDYIPHYPKQRGGQVTVHHLLTHTSGIPSYTGLPGFMEDRSRDPYDPDEFLEQFSELDLHFEPGSEFRYSNSGYFLLGVIIEHVTGVPYAEALQEMVLAPLDLRNTGYDHHKNILENRATGYSRTFDGYEVADYLDMSLPYAAGSMYSTVRDLFKWDRLLYTDSVFEDPKTKELMFTPNLSNYGYGWFIADFTIGDGGRKVKLIQHGGGINGFNTGFWRLVDDQHTIVVMDNTQCGANLGGLRRGIANILYGEPADPPTRSIANALRETIRDSGVVAAIEQYRRLKDAESDAYDFGEPELNNLGYHYLRAGDTETAIAVFKLNVEVYPDAWNTYDSLGEAYMETGERQLAIENYEKSLELNPRSENGKAMLAKLGVEVDADLGKEIGVPVAILERYVGKYELRPNFVLTITLAGTQLMTQATGQSQVEIFAESETKFFLKVVEAQLQFDVGDDGVVKGVTLFQGGQEIYGKRIE